ncbi:bifunctional diaminohydroxyphosphoribosylaminopyrimidine deaminase/5-amino-6-(5-phosphoribosylamino)uracil reductase RibD [Prosthecobacter sp.]|uniref:bifunctional diaminohydroxyphosphoribosylaminopyrimidine deaminase/5-amino-6-(5-phosphoribosylamino)uracil reductase RibD n=1 Tax=Prosthecobacter sp. TaxID=1965333 RepID=UPI001D4D1270|nr:bifunctional diaminohydroxyphosphoribosylaminopyrimidine deaminase/5-amino-6-(5-phosphoribosylamino)uracil reductase RibD [Prosthecobacter sp.]MCB1277246.1 bifunctional diaminohydroxyphosphoribosylaminopyrimidine deaminase/5-amino-6-(5-phosphoribosylamino)uracil reductase RibD [Prosthecobacter sp.]
MPPPIAYKETPDQHWMHLALDQAQLGAGLTSPNPTVGAVIVAQDKVIGRGYHHKAGEPHAEVEAIRDAQKSNPKLLRGSTIYVTLEPCCTSGRTPPCTEAIKTAGIKRVVFGAYDPNPKHHEQSRDIFLLAGIEVTAGVLEAECRAIIRPFTKWITTGIPYVIAKAGQSLDGRITRPAGESQWITNDAARAHGRRLRMRVDAILVGAETIRKDNPQLTLRDGSSGSGKMQPWRVVLTRSGDLPPHSHIFTDSFKDRTVIMRGKDLPEVLADLGKGGVLSVLIEGGGIILGQAFRERLVDEVYWYIAPRLCGGGRPSLAGSALPQSIRLDDVTVRPMGDNVMMHGFPIWPEEP